MADRMIDLFYKKGKLFTMFLPESPAGEVAWKQIAEATSGTGQILTIQLPDFLYRLRKAGYVVRAEKKKQAITVDELAEELGEA